MVTHTRPVAVQKRSNTLLSVLLALHPLTNAEYAITHVAVMDLWEAVSPGDWPYPLLQLLASEHDKALQACEDLLQHQSSMQPMDDIEKGITRLVRQIRVARASIPVTTKATTAGPLVQSNVPEQPVAGQQRDKSEEPSTTNRSS